MNLSVYMCTVMILTKAVITEELQSFLPGMGTSSTTILEIIYWTKSFRENFYLCIKSNLKLRNCQVNENVEWKWHVTNDAGRPPPTFWLELFPKEKYFIMNEESGFYGPFIVQNPNWQTFSSRWWIREQTKNEINHKNTLNRIICHSSNIACNDIINLKGKYVLGPPCVIQAADSFSQIKAHLL